MECGYLTKTGGCNCDRLTRFKKETPSIKNQPYSCSVAGNLEAQKRCDSYAEKINILPIISKDK